MTSSLARRPEIFCWVFSGRTPRCALTEIGRGAAWVKVIADFPDLAAGTGAEPTYPIGSIAQLVAAVHKAGARVAVQSTIPNASQLVAAGADSIEHGFGLDETAPAG